MGGRRDFDIRARARRRGRLRAHKTKMKRLDAEISRLRKLYNLKRKLGMVT